MTSNRHAQANNPAVGTFNTEQPLSYIVDWVANNLDGCAMSQFLPFEHFSLVKK